MLYFAHRNVDKILSIFMTVSDEEIAIRAKITLMLRGILVFVFFITLILFPAQSGLCQPKNAPVRVVTNPCNDTIQFELTTSTTGTAVFSLLAPTLNTDDPEVVASPLAHPPLLNPQEPVQAKIDPPPRPVSLF